jgi:hypothetical protein
MPTSRYTSLKPMYQGHAYNQPPQAAIAVFEWEQFSPLVNYSDAALNQVFQRISRDIIERPYHYADHRVLDNQGLKIASAFRVATNTAPPSRIQNGLVYKQNHGTAHAMRQMIYADNLLEIISDKGTPEGKRLVQSVRTNPQITALIKLAAFCKRIGRTLDYEVDHQNHSPTIYSKRSAEMFGKIASELGFDAKLIHIVHDSMLEYADSYRATSTPTYDDFNGMPGTDLKAFSKAVLMASHMADLVRIFSVRQDYLRRTLIPYVEGDQLDAVAKDLTNLACKENNNTGSGFVGQERGVAQGITSSRSPSRAAAVVLRFYDTIEALTQISHLSRHRPSSVVSVPSMQLVHPVTQSTAIARQTSKTNDSSFIFHCVASAILATGGGACLVSGLVLGNPLLIVIGAVLLASGVLYGGVSTYGLFAQPNQRDHTELAPGANLSLA